MFQGVTRQDFNPWLIALIVAVAAVSLGLGIWWTFAAMMLGLASQVLTARWRAQRRLRANGRR